VQFAHWQNASGLAFAADVPRNVTFIESTAIYAACPAMGLPHHSRQTNPLERI
jgi:hypothetical protein